MKLDPFIINKLQYNLYMDILKGKTALITGAAKRVGRAVALAMAERGINTVIHYSSSPEEADETVRLSRKLGVESAKISCDFKESSGVKNLLKTAAELTGSIDILINSASVYPVDSLDNLDPEDLSEVLNINTMAPFILAREFGRVCNGGSIINFLDARMTDFETKHISYQLSKQMLFSLTRMMALELAPGIRVNAVAPGIIIPENSNNESMIKKLKNGNPLNRIGRLDEVTDSVLFLLENSFITGQVIYVDGGRNIRGNVYGY